MTKVVRSAWVYHYVHNLASGCIERCAYHCADAIQNDAHVRGGVFGSAGNSRTTLIFITGLPRYARNDKELFGPPGCTTTNTAQRPTVRRLVHHIVVMLGVVLLTAGAFSGRPAIDNDYYANNNYYKKTPP